MPQGLSVYIVTVVLLAIAAIVLISQRATINRRGYETAVFRREATETEASIARLRLRLARLKSAERIAAEAEYLQLDLVPPEALPPSGSEQRGDTR